MINWASVALLLPGHGCSLPYLENEKGKRTGRGNDEHSMGKSRQRRMDLSEAVKN